MSKWQDACAMMLKWVTAMDMNYGQGNASFPLPRYDYSYGGSTDCSAMVGFILSSVGYEGAVKWWSSWTIANILVDNGWTAVPSDGKPPKSGCVLVSTNHHVGMWDAETNTCMEFGGDPHKGYSTVHGWYDYPWDYYVFPPEEGMSESEEEMHECIIWTDGQQPLYVRVGANGSVFRKIIANGSELEAIKRTHMALFGGAIGEATMSDADQRKAVSKFYAVK